MPLYLLDRMISSYGTKVLCLLYFVAFCFWVPQFTLPTKSQFPQYLMDMQNTPSAMSGHVQALLCKKLNPECEDKWCSDSENFINPSRGNFLLDHSTIQ